MRLAVRDSKNAGGPMKIIFSSGDFVKSANVDYRGGVRYPHLQRIPNTADLLTELGKPLARR